MADPYRKAPAVGPVQGPVGPADPRRMVDGFIASRTDAYARDGVQPPDFGQMNAVNDPYAARGWAERTFRPLLDAGIAQAGHAFERFMGTPQGEDARASAEDIYGKAAAAFGPQVQTFMQTPLRDAAVEGAQAFVQGASIPEAFGQAREYASEHARSYGETLAGSGEPVPERSFNEIEGMPQWAGTVADIAVSMIDVGGAIGRIARGVEAGVQALRGGGKILNFADDGGDALRRARADFSDEAMEGMAREATGQTMDVPRFSQTDTPFTTAREAGKDGDALLLRRGSTAGDYAAYRAEAETLQERIRSMTWQEIEAQFAIENPADAWILFGNRTAVGRREAALEMQEVAIDDIEAVIWGMRSAEEAENVRSVGRMHSLDELGIQRSADVNPDDLVRQGITLEQHERNSFETLASIGAMGDYVDDAARTEALALVSNHSVMAAFRNDEHPELVRAWLNAARSLGGEYAIIATRALDGSGDPRDLARSISAEWQLREFTDQGRDLLLRIPDGDVVPKAMDEFALRYREAMELTEHLFSATETPLRPFSRAFAEAEEVRALVVAAGQDTGLLQRSLPPVPPPVSIGAQVLNNIGDRTPTNAELRAIFEYIDNMPAGMMPEVMIGDLEQARRVLSQAFADAVVNEGSWQVSQQLNARIRNVNMMIDDLLQKLPPGQRRAYRLGEEARTAADNVQGGFVDDATEAIARDLKEFLDTNPTDVPPHTLDELWELYHRINLGPDSGMPPTRPAPPPDAPGGDTMSAMRQGDTPPRPSAGSYQAIEGLLNEAIQQDAPTAEQATALIEYLRNPPTDITAEQQSSMVFRSINMLHRRYLASSDAAEQRALGNAIHTLDEVVRKLNLDGGLPPIRPAGLLPDEPSGDTMSAMRLGDATTPQGQALNERFVMMTPQQQADFTRGQEAFADVVMQGAATPEEFERRFTEAARLMGFTPEEALAPGSPLFQGPFEGFRIQIARMLGLGDAPPSPRPAGLLPDDAPSGDTMSAMRAADEAQFRAQAGGEILFRLQDNANAPTFDEATSIVAYWKAMSPEQIRQNPEKAASVLNAIRSVFARVSISPALHAPVGTPLTREQINQVQKWREEAAEQLGRVIRRDFDGPPPPRPAGLLPDGQDGDALAALRAADENAAQPPYSDPRDAARHAPGGGPADWIVRQHEMAEGLVREINQGIASGLSQEQAEALLRRIDDLSAYDRGEHASMPAFNALRDARAALTNTMARSAGLPPYNPEGMAELTSRVSAWINEPYASRAEGRDLLRMLDEWIPRVFTDTKSLLEARGGHQLAELWQRLKYLVGPG